MTERYEATLGGRPVVIEAPLGGTGWDILELFPPGVHGLDVESTYMDELGQFSPDFEVRLAQFGREDGYALVLDMTYPEQYEAARKLLGAPDRLFCSHTAMDVLSAATRLGVDITGRNLDTRLLAKMAYPEKGEDLDLKSLATRHGMPELAVADKDLYAHFVELWTAAGGKANAKRSEIERYGWSAVDVRDERYRIYAGLDAIACRRLLPTLAEATGAPPELLRIESWLAGQANRIKIRGMRVDEKALDELAASAQVPLDQAKADLAAIIRSHPPTTCPTWDSWTDKKRAEGLSPLSPSLRPHTRYRKGADGKAVKKRVGKGYETEHCCDGWLAEHGAQWDQWEELGGAFTDTGQPSLDKENVAHLGAFELDEAGRAAYDALCRYKEHQDVVNKTAGLRKLIDPLGMIHPTLHTVGAVTGRMASVEPNFQNFSKKEARLRGLFIPRPGYVLMTADFDQVELRVVAALAREQKMIDTILAGGDLHQLTVDELAKAGVEISRDTGKMTNFLIVYGGGAGALSTQAGIPLDVAYKIVSAHRERYPAITRLAQKLGQERNAVRNIASRRIPVTRNKAGELRTFANINYVVQSSARELLVHAWYRFAVEFGRADMVWFPVHDELVLEVPVGLVEIVKAEIERCMRFDFMGVPISASAVIMRDAQGVSRWMTSKLAEQYDQERAQAATEPQDLLAMTEIDHSGIRPITRDQFMDLVTTGTPS